MSKGIGLRLRSSARPIVGRAVLNLAKAVPAQARLALDNNKAKMIGGSIPKNRPPHAKPEDFPNFKIPGTTRDRAYLIEGRVYAAVYNHPPLSKTGILKDLAVWFDCGKAPTAPAL